MLQVLNTFNDVLLRNGEPSWSVQVRVIMWRLQSAVHRNPRILEEMWAVNIEAVASERRGPMIYTGELGRLLYEETLVDKDGMMFDEVFNVIACAVAWDNERNRWVLVDPVIGVASLVHPANWFECPN